MVADELQVSVGKSNIKFDPATVSCETCVESGYRHCVDIDPQDTEIAISITVTCESCEERVFNTTYVEDRAEEGLQSLDPDSKQLYNWIENYIRSENRKPTKSKCVQEVSLEIFRAQEVLDTLISEGWLETVEQHRAGSKMTVIQPA